METAVIFGAGSVGRGFIGQLFAESGLAVVFVDVVREIIDGINQHHSYPHITVSSLGREQTLITNVIAINSGDEAQVIEAIADASILATAVGANVLPKISGVLARGLQRRADLGRPPINILLCENLHDAANFMGGQLTDHLDDAHRDAVLLQTGLLETSIGRMIPVPSAETQAIHPAAVCVEPYKILPYDAAAIKGKMPSITGLVGDLTVPFQFYSDRKLYIHNLGHCFCAYLGEKVGDEYIAQAIRRPEIRYVVRAAMLESALALSVSYGQPMASLVDHVDDLLARFGNRELLDTVERVGRDPARKMAPGDRFLGAYALAATTRMPRRHLALAVACGLNKLGLQNGWTAEQGLLFLQQALPMTDGELNRIAFFLDQLRAGWDFAELISLIDHELTTEIII